MLNHINQQVMQRNQNILFKDWQWQESLDRLNTLLYINEKIILVVGEHQSGKTTLKQEIIDHLSNDFKKSTIVADRKMTITLFMQQVYLSFGLVWKSHLPQDWEELRKTVCNKIDYNWIVIIDDAEKLSWELLNSLISLYITLNSEHNNFHLIFFAQNIFLENIKNSLLNDFFEVKFEIINFPTLNLTEMTAFLSNNMQLNFNNKTLKKIHLASNGIIGKVIQLAISEENMHKVKNNQFIHKLLESIINPLTIRIIVCACLLVIAYIIFNLSKKSEITATINKDNNALLHSKHPKQVDKSTVDGTVSVSSIATEDLLNINNQIEQELINNVAIEQNVINSSTASIEKDLINASIGQDLINNHSNIQIEIDKIKNHIKQIKHSQQTKYEIIYQELYQKLQNNLQQQLTRLEEKINELQSIIQVANNNKVQPNIPVPGNQDLITNKAINNTNKFINNNNLIKKSKKTHLLDSNTTKTTTTKNFYVLQLMASKNEQSILNLINNYSKNVKKITYFKGKFNPKGDLWFIAIYGNYPNPKAAIKDLKSLPIEIRKLKPLVRDFKSVKLLINN